MLTGKHILVGVTGSIAAYKAAELTSMLIKQGASVKVIMTESATKFIMPLTFTSLTHNPVAVDMFSDPISWDIEHISLAKWADLAIVVPATANIIGKLASGIADDMLSTVLMATKAPIIIAPAMNTVMYESAAVQSNIDTLKKRGVMFVGPEHGKLACGDTGSGKLVRVEVILDAILNCVAFKKDLAGLNILITAGATIESIDPVRYITNHSSGKMGIEIARAAKYRGANVTLVYASITVALPEGVKSIEAKSAMDMYRVCGELFPKNDVLIKAAAVADFRPAVYAEHKIKKNDAISDTMSVELTKNIDILKELSAKKRDNQVIIGFCMETKNLIENAQKKLREKKLDMIVANNLFDENAGFASNNNTVTILDVYGRSDKLPNMSKFMVANKILDRILTSGFSK